MHPRPDAAHRWTFSAAARAFADALVLAGAVNAAGALLMLSLSLGFTLFGRGPWLVALLAPLSGTVSWTTAHPPLLQASSPWEEPAPEGSCVEPFGVNTQLRVTGVPYWQSFSTGGGVVWARVGPRHACRAWMLKDCQGLSDLLLVRRELGVDSPEGVRPRPARIGALGAAPVHMRHCWRGSLTGPGTAELHGCDGAQLECGTTGVSVLSHEARLPLGPVLRALSPDASTDQAATRVDLAPLMEILDAGEWTIERSVGR
jgi:hypothetical protein